MCGCLLMKPAPPESREHSIAPNRIPLMKTFSINALDRSLESELRQRIDGKTKPLGSLGRLEALALQIGLIQNRLDPVLQRPAMLVFAGDHGLATMAVSAYPQAVTQQMVLNFLAGGAAINVLCRQFGLDLCVVNAGVNAEFDAHPMLYDCPIAAGTANMLDVPAMSIEQAELAISRGAELVNERAEQGCTIIGFGEMGIGNTSSASLLLSRLCGLPLSDVVGRGTGQDDAGMLHKTSILQQVLRRHTSVYEPLPVLATFGGFEIAMLVGAFLQAAERRMVILVDGFIASAALLVASRMHADVVDYCIFAHRSQEKGHAAMLRELKADPLLDLGMRLGEGSGAATAYPLVAAAVALLNDMASFSSAGVSESMAGTS